jgi:hypothetical protein
MKRNVYIALMIMLPGLSFSQQYIAGYEVAREDVLRGIPKEYIDKARAELVVAYQHTSHGTQTSRGLFGLPDYKDGDETLYAISLNKQDGSLEFRDYALQDYAPSGVNGTDLSADETAFIQTTRNYLDAPENASVNVVMWAWCNIADHDVAGHYLPGMDSLISEYGPGGSKIGTGAGQREVAVTFVFMTGHANWNANLGDLKPKSQAALITDHCNANNYYCLDYFSIDTHDMDDTYWEDAGDNGHSMTYGGNFLEDWQNAHVLGEDYFENRVTPGGEVDFGAHNTQHVTANRKGYAMWWIMARIAGWDGVHSSVYHYSDSHISIYPNPSRGQFFLDNIPPETHEIRVYRMDGELVKSMIISSVGNPMEVNLSNNPGGTYGLQFLNGNKVFDKSKVIIAR